MLESRSGHRAPCGCQKRGWGWGGGWHWTQRKWLPKQECLGGSRLGVGSTPLGYPSGAVLMIYDANTSFTLRSALGRGRGGWGWGDGCGAGKRCSPGKPRPDPGRGTMAQPRSSHLQNENDWLLSFHIGGARRGRGRDGGPEWSARDAAKDRRSGRNELSVFGRWEGVCECHRQAGSPPPPTWRAGSSLCIKLP